MAVQQRKHNMEDEDLSPFYQLQKSQVLHEAKAFNDTPLDSRKCCSVLTELLCLLSQGEVLGKEEGTGLFFGVTKLFQSQDPQLRRLVYLVIKELNKNQDDAFIVISSLEKDINGSVELFRANALRVHSKVIDSSMLEQRARLFRQAIVNKNDHISSSALCAGIRMFSGNPEVIRRWVNETREATKSSSKMVSFHALHLLYKIHEHDGRAIMRLVTSMINSPSDSALSRCLLIRYAYSCISSLSSSSSSSISVCILEFIKDQIKEYKNPMVMFEAAKCLCHLKLSTESDLIIAMNVLQEFLNSPRPIQRFAAVRALSTIVNRFNNILSPSCTVDLEHLISDGNRNIATLAITTLLKTTAEYSIERLLSSITEFMTEIADELKIVLIDAIKKVCKKFPKKYESLLNFLSMALREEGGYLYKNKIVDCMLILMDEPGGPGRAKEFGLDSLCEFIEDCEYPLLSVRILYLIGELGPKTLSPERYIRFIYNRVLLELPCVRSAAVSCLCKCAVEKAILKNDIYKLLEKSLNDEDDEVRDRATLYVALLENFIEIRTISEIKENEQDLDDDDIVEITKNEIIKYEAPPELINIIKIDENSFDFNLRELESSLLLYLADNEEKEEDDDNNNVAFANSFSIDNISDFREKEVELEKEKLLSGKTDNLSLSSRPHKVSSIGITQETINPYGAQSKSNLYSSLDEYLEFISSKKNDLPDLGKLICSSSIQQLTEPEAEYQVECIKRVYSKYLLLQFNISNTIQGQLITDVYVEIDYDDTNISNLTCPLIKCNGEYGIALSIIDRQDDDDDDQDDDEYILGSFECVLKFIVKDDTDDVQFEEGEDDEYILNDLIICHTDYIYSAIGDDILSTMKLKEKWQILGKETEIRKKGQLNFHNLQNAVTEIVKKVGLTPVEESNKIDDENQIQHGLNLISYTDKNQTIAMRAAFVKNDDNVSYKAAVRCKNTLLRNACLAAI